MNIYDEIKRIERYGKKHFDIQKPTENRRITGYQLDGYFCILTKVKGEVESFEHLDHESKDFKNLKLKYGNKDQSTSKSKM